MTKTFKYNGVSCLSLHDVVSIVNNLKTKDEASKFMKAFREHMNNIGDSQLSKFVQKRYADDSSRFHEFLDLEMFVDPRNEPTVPSKTSKKSKGKDGSETNQ